MDTKNLTLEIVEAVKDILGDSYIVLTNKVTKNNGVVLTGLMIGKNGQNVMPTIYIDEFFDWYKSGYPVRLIANKIVRLYKQANAETPFDTSLITNFNLVKDRIIFQIVNTERNSALLETIPSVKFHDLSIIFKICFENSSYGTATAMITNRIMDFWSVDIDTICQMAMKNTPAIQESVLCRMEDVLKELMPKAVMIPSLGIDMFVLTNKLKNCGCGCILYPYVLEDFSTRMGKDIFILPSSRHEVLLLPDNGMNSRELKEMVMDVNKTQVSREDFLSDNVYHYSRETKQITILQ